MQASKSAGRKTLRSALLIAGALAIALAGLLMLNGWILTARKVGIEAHIMGEILVLFVYDHDRVPAGVDELVELQYLSRNTAGEIWTGPRSLNRPPDRWAPRGQEMCFQHLDKFIFSPAEATREGRGYFRVRGSDVGDSYAEHFSDIIRRMLTEQIHKRTGPESGPAA